MSWAEFILNAPRQAHDTTRRAVAHVSVDYQPRALDIGAGNGRDSIFLSDNGFLVDAVDTSPESGKMMSELEAVQYIQSDIVGFKLEKYDLVNASLVFPFIGRADFEEFWIHLSESLAQNAVVCGHLFGDNDWKVAAGSAWGVSIAECMGLLKQYEIKYFNEFDDQGIVQSGGKKRKHNYSFVLKAANNALCS